MDRLEAPRKGVGAAGVDPTAADGCAAGVDPTGAVETKNSLIGG